MAEGNAEVKAVFDASTVDATSLHKHPSYVAEILVVEDNALCRKVLGIFLTRQKISFAMAMDGQEAVNRLRDGEVYRVILMDKEMPVLDGHEATKAIREFNKLIPIVGLTGNALDEQRLEFMACGADQVLIKPLNKSHFNDVVLTYNVQRAASPTAS